MKSLPLGFVCALLAGVAAAAESDLAASAPQPRVRLDPVVREAVASSAVETKSDPTVEPVVTLDRFVVKGIAAMPFVHRKEPVLQGKFTPLRGGSFFERDIGKARAQFGFWPWLDLFEDDASFRHPPVLRINVVLFRLGW